MLSEREIAKYPFLSSGIQLIESINIKLDDLINPNYTKVLDRAIERIIESLIKGEVSVKLSDPLIELLSFPVAVMYVSLVDDRFLNRRYSLAEAIRVYHLLKNESEEKIIKIAVNEFNWNIKRDIENIQVMGLGKVIQMADFKILNNEQGFGNLQKDIDDLISKIDH